MFSAILLAAMTPATLPDLSAIASEVVSRPRSVARVNVNVGRGFGAFRGARTVGVNRAFGFRNFNRFNRFAFRSFHNVGYGYGLGVGSYAYSAPVVASYAAADYAAPALEAAPCVGATYAAAPAVYAAPLVYAAPAVYAPGCYGASYAFSPGFGYRSFAFRSFGRGFHHR